MATMKDKKGVDISYANGNIDLAKVKNAGYDFVMIRCGYGSDITSQDDTQFASNVAKAEKLGMPWGVYLFSYACSTADAQSELVHIDRLLKAQAKKGYYPTMPIALDIEPSNYVSNKGAWTKANLTNVATIVLDGLAKLGYYPMIYTGYSELDGMLSDHIRKDYDCWFAQWNSTPNAYKYNRLGIWQYGGETNYIDGNSISGVGVIDKNRCYKDYPTIIKNGGYNGFKKSSTSNSGSVNSGSSSSSSSNSGSTTIKSTVKYTAETVVALAKAEVGYKEKANNSQLDSKTANAGSNNWTKYAAYIDKNAPDFYNGKKNGFDWCDIFNDYIHIMAAGDAEVARKALYQPKKSTGAGCSYSAQFYRDNNAWTNGGGTPKIGDQIFFGTRGNEYHTGIVVKVDKTYVYTVEGNSSEMVADRKYLLTDSKISGYGHPKYTGQASTVTIPTTSTTTTTTSKSVPDITYRVRANGKWWGEIKNLTDYAGVVGYPITDVAIKVSKGSVKYRVHVKGGSWLGWITGYNINNSATGYAGNGKPIDAIEVYYSTPSDVKNSLGYYLKAKYRVSPVKGEYYDWQHDNEKSNGQDGYAGAFGKTVDRLQITLSK